MEAADEDVSVIENPALSSEKAEDKKDDKTIVIDMDEDKEDNTELQKYWKTVKDNPADFTGWTYLLQYVEQENNVDHTKEAFDSFLARYPYCYGYWKKYTDFLKKHDELDSAEQVFERGVKAIPLSIDLWVHYINFANVKYSDLPGKENKVRDLFERGIVAAGTDFRSDKLWDTYLSWEKENKNERGVTALYDRLLKIPTQLYSQKFENFCEHIMKHHPKNLLSLDEFLRLRKEVAKPTVEGHPVEEVGGGSEEPSVPGQEDGGSGDADDPPPGLEADEAPPGEDGDKPKEEKVCKKPPGDEEEVPLLQKKIIALRKEVHNRTEEEVSKRWAYEERIRRPYFHVKPLERAQLRNWREYLEFEIQEGVHERVVVLFERCLIACALYEEFWLKYAEYMDKHSAEGVRSVYQRACQIHLPKKPSLHLAWAAFEERQGCYDAAVAVFDQLDKSIAGLAMVCMRRISMDRRQGHLDKVQQLYLEKVDKAENGQVKAFYSIKYARYLAKTAFNIPAAKEVLNTALKEDPNNPKLILQLIDVVFSQAVVEEADMCEQFDLGINSTMAVEHRVAFSQRKLEYLEDFGSDVTKLLECYENHQKLLKELQSSRKRKTDGQTDATSEGKKLKSDSSSVSAAATVNTTATNGNTDQHMVSSTTDAANYYNAAAQYNYNYGNYGNYHWGQYGYY